MDTASMAAHATPDRAPHWVTEFYAAVDAGDGRAAANRLAPGVTVQVAARPPVTGREAAGDTLRAFHGSFDRVSHAFRNVWTAGETVICEFTATYLLHDGRRVALPTMTVLRRAGDLIAEMRVYIDEGALRDAAAEKMTPGISD